MAENRYVTIKHEAVAEFEEKRSVFIGYAKPVKSEEEAAEFIKAIKSKHNHTTFTMCNYNIPF